MKSDLRPYVELLKDPRWQRRRLQIFERDNFECKACGSREKTLHVHHLRYQSGRPPWESPDVDLDTLCEDCHRRLGEERKRARAEFDARAEDYNDLQIMGFLQGLAWERAQYPGDGDLIIESHEHAAGFGAAFGVFAEEVIALVGNGGVLTSDAITVLRERGAGRWKAAVKDLGQ